MFDILPNTLSLVLTTLLPVYAAHKALSTPASTTTLTTTQKPLAPWLTYFLVLSLASLLDPFLSILPFSAYIRLALRCWLLLPGESQGASFVYTAYVQPFLHQHERDIETFINDAHDQGKTLVAEWMRRMVEAVKTQLLGQTRSPAQAESTSVTSGTRREVPYAQRLLAVFNGTAPQSQPQQAQGSSSTSGASGSAAVSLGNALQQATAALAYAASTSTSSSAPSAPGHNPQQQHFQMPSFDLGHAAAALIPSNLSSAAERLGYVTAQKEKLRALLKAFEREEASVGSSLTPSGGETPPADLKKSGSEADFDRIEHHEVAAASCSGGNNVSSGARSVSSEPKSKGWGTWVWGGKIQPNSGAGGKVKVDGTQTDKDEILIDQGVGKSSAVEI